MLGGTKTIHIPLHPLHSCQTRFVCGYLFLGLCSVQDMENLLQVLYNGSKVLLLEIQFYLQYVYNVLIRIETTALLVDLESPKIVSYI